MGQKSTKSPPSPPSSPPLSPSKTYSPFYPSHLYLFGLSESSKPTIICFSALNQQFTSISVPSNLLISNYSGVVHIGENQIIIVGGILNNEKDLTNFLNNQKSHSNEDNRINLTHMTKDDNREQSNNNQNSESEVRSSQGVEKDNLGVSLVLPFTFDYDPIINQVNQLENLSFPRYGHISTFYKGKVVAIGGRNKTGNLLDSAEAYDRTKGWKNMGTLNKGRAGGYAVLNGNFLYVWGGFGLEMKRSRSVEKYDDTSGKWILLNFKINRGIESAVILPGKTNEILIIGGQTRGGPTNSVLSLNLHEKTIHFLSKMTCNRGNPKGLQYKGIFFIFGGEGASSTFVEKSSINTWEWAETFAKYTEFIHSNETLSKFSQSQTPIVINEGFGEKLDNSRSDSDEVLYLFGTDNEPFILEFNITKDRAKSLPVPLSLELCCYQGGVKLENSYYFLCGGIHFQMDFICRKCFIYRADEKRAEKQLDMFQQRYTFSTIYKKPYIYAIGGRTYGEDREAILSSCERFNLLTGEWQKIAALNYPRCSAMSFLLKGKILLIGGYKGNGERHNTFEVYDDSRNAWELGNNGLNDGIEAGSIEAIGDNKILILGGRRINGDSNECMMLEFDKGLREVKIGNYGNIGNIGKCLHKSYRMKHYKWSDWIIIFGGDEGKSVEFFNIRKKKIDEGGEEIKKIGEEFRLEVELRIGDMRMKRYLLL